MFACSDKDFDYEKVREEVEAINQVGFTHLKESPSIVSHLSEVFTVDIKRKERLSNIKTLVETNEKEILRTLKMRRFTISSYSGVHQIIRYIPVEGTYVSILSYNGGYKVIYKAELQAIYKVTKEQYDIETGGNTVVDIRVAKKCVVDYVLSIDKKAETIKRTRFKIHYPVMHSNTMETPLDFERSGLVTSNMVELTEKTKKKTTRRRYTKPKRIAKKNNHLVKYCIF